MLCTPALQTPWQHIRSLPRHHHRNTPHHYLSLHTIPSHHPHTTSSHFSTPHATPSAPRSTCATATRAIRLPRPSTAPYSCTMPRLSSVPHAPRASHLHTTSSRFSAHTTCGSGQLTPRPTAHRHTLRMHGRRRLGLQWHLSHRTPPVLLHSRHAPVPRHTSAAYHIRLAHHTSTPRPHASALTRYALRTAPLHYPSRHLTPAHTTCGSGQLTPRPTAHRHTLRMHGRRRLASHLHISVTCPYITHLHPSHRAPPVLLQLRTIRLLRHAPAPRHTSAAYHILFARYCACAVRRCAPGAAQR
jgi:hypothetical protein